MKKVLLLVGSPRGNRSTSKSLITYMASKFEEHGLDTEVKMVYTALLSEDKTIDLIKAVDSSTILILAAPLYVDAIPAPVIKILERIAENRAGTVSSRPLFAAIFNSGFPEPEHNFLALDMCRLFAEDANLEWAGGLPFGGGATINGTPLESAGGRARHVVPALDIAVDALVKGEKIPSGAVERISKPVIPRRLYVMAAQRRWKQQAKQNGVGRQLAATPYVKE